MGNQEQQREGEFARNQVTERNGKRGVRGEDTRPGRGQMED